MIRILLSVVAILIVIGIMSSLKQGDEESPTDVRTARTPATGREQLSGRKGKRQYPGEQVVAIFDVPSLIDKDIDGVRQTLGDPIDDQIEPTSLQVQVGIDEWSNQFQKSGHTLLVTFKPSTRKIVDFFLEGSNKTTLMRQMRLQEGATDYRVEPVRSIKNRSQITGIKIIPK